MRAKRSVEIGDLTIFYSQDQVVGFHEREATTGGFRWLHNDGDNVQGRHIREWRNRFLQGVTNPGLDRATFQQRLGVALLRYNLIRPPVLADY